MEQYGTGFLCVESSGNYKSYAEI